MSFAPRGRTLVWVVVGALAILGAVMVDPAALALLLDVDFVILVGSVGLMMLGTDLRTFGRRVVGATRLTAGARTRR